MHPPGADVVLVRYGDLGTKSRSVTHDMTHQLGANLEAMLADRGLAGDVELAWSRPRVHTTTADVDAVARAVADTFGVVSASPARQVPATVDAIESALADAAVACYDDGSFAVDARRADKSVDFDSETVARAGGQAIWDAVVDDVDPVVDLDDPDLTFGVEVRESGAFVFTDRVEGVGGLPLGTQRPVVATISGGIDSPVAAFQMMKRGCPIVPVYVDLGAYGGPDHRARAIETISALARYAPGTDLSTWVVPGGDAVSALVDAMNQGRMLSHRRFVLQVADGVAERVDAVGVVTGEAIGQKSSQTVSNLAVTDAAVDRPVHRPLLTWDKQEITAVARRIGTFEDATIDAGCNRIVPPAPSVEASLSTIREREPDGLSEWAADAVADADRQSVTAATDADAPVEE